MVRNYDKAYLNLNFTITSNLKNIEFITKFMAL